MWLLLINEVNWKKWEFVIETVPSGRAGILCILLSSARLLRALIHGGPSALSEVLAFSSASDNHRFHVSTHLAFLLQIADILSFRESQDPVTTIPSCPLLSSLFFLSVETLYPHLKRNPLSRCKQTPPLLSPLLAKSLGQWQVGRNEIPSTPMKEACRGTRNDDDKIILKQSGIAAGMWKMSLMF